MNKTCTSCGKEKDISYFSRRIASKDGYSASCKECVSIRKKNASATSEYNKKYHSEHREFLNVKTKNWRTQNKDYVNFYKRVYRKSNPDKHAVLDANKNAKRQLRFPKWLSENDLVEIAEFYKLARTLSSTTGVKHQVDHIVPLNGKTVSGLHVPWNLQILTAYENNCKNNKHEVC